MISATFPAAMAIRMVAALRVPELQSELRRLGQRNEGRKKELVDRLVKLWSDQNSIVVDNKKRKREIMLVPQLHMNATGFLLQNEAQLFNLLLPFFNECNRTSLRQVAQLWNRACDNQHTCAFSTHSTCCLVANADFLAVPRKQQCHLLFHLGKSASELSSLRMHLHWHELFMFEWLLKRCCTSALSTIELKTGRSRFPPPRLMDPPFVDIANGVSAQTMELADHQNKLCLMESASRVSLGAIGELSLDAPWLDAYNTPWHVLRSIQQSCPKLLKLKISVWLLLRPPAVVDYMHTSGIRRTNHSGSVVHHTPAFGTVKSLTLYGGGFAGGQQWAHEISPFIQRQPVLEALQCVGFRSEDNFGFKSDSLQVIQL